MVPESLDLEFRKSFLKRRSFEIRWATCGSEALAAAAIWHPDLVLFSSHLGDMTAAQFCTAVRGQPATENTKLLMLTDQYGSESSADLLRVACDAHLLEPIDTEQLLRAIGGLLDVRVRRGVRAEVELLAQIDQSEEEGEEEEEEEPLGVMANILSISDTGMLLECERHLQIGSLAEVHFFLPGARERLTLSCMVLYADELKLHYGVEFVGVDRERLAIIAAFVDSAHDREDEGEGSER